MPKNAGILIEQGFFRFGKTKLSNGRVSPYSTRMPVPTPPSFLETLGKSAVSLRVFRGGTCFHLVGVAKSAVAVTYAIAEALRQRKKEVHVAIVDPRTEKLEGELPQDVDRRIIIDNAVTTGSTLRKVKSILRAAGYPVENAIYIFDREIATFAFSYVF